MVLELELTVQTGTSQKRVRVIGLGTEANPRHFMCRWHRG